MFGRRKNDDEASPKEAAKAHEAGAVLLDVREPHEWDAGHAPGAVHLPLDRIGQATTVVGERVVYAVCRSGRRSATATKVMNAAGLKARNVKGGMQAWSRAGLPVVVDDGRPGTVA